MKVIKFISYILLLCLAGALFSNCGATSDDGSKLPITTVSAEAHQLFIQGRNLQEKLRALEARPYFQKAIERDPGFALAYLNLALTATSAKEFFAAQDKAASLVDNVSDGEKWWILGFKAGTDGDPTTQKKYYEKLAKAYPNDERCQNILGGQYFGQQEYDKAIEQYEKAVAINPDFSPPYNLLGYAYRFLEKYDDSERIFQKYIEVIPDDPNPYDSYAELLLKIGKYDESIENYRKALQLDRHFAASHIGIATNYNYKGEHALARKELEKLYEIAQNDGQRRAALFASTVSYVHEGNVEMALLQQEKMHDLASKINDAAAMAGDLGTMARIQLEFGKPEAALEKFNESLRVIRESNLSKEQKALAERFHFANLAQVAIKRGDLAKAQKDADEFKRQAEAAHNRFQIWLAHQLAGMIALEKKDYAKAVEELKQSNQQNPLNLYRLAMAYDGAGDATKAGAMYKKVQNFNALNSLNQAFVKIRSKKMISIKS